MLAPAVYRPFDHKDPDNRTCPRISRDIQQIPGLETKASTALDLLREDKSFKLEVKSIDEKAGTFQGYAAVFGNRDSDGDILVKGAFKRSIATKKVVPILWQHDTKTPVGFSLELSEDEYGLAVEGSLTIEAPDGKNAWEFLKKAKECGADAGLSIGYAVPKDGAEYKDGTRYLKEVALWEFSIVTFAANQLAHATSVKAVVPYQNLPLGDEAHGWDKSAAEARIKEWAGGADSMDWAKYRKAFLWYDGENPELYGSYKFPIADIVEGKLTAIPKGISAAAGRLSGGSSTIPDNDQASMKAHLERYYKKMGKDSPFAKAAPGAPEFKAEDFNSSLAEARAMHDLYEVRWQYESALSDAIQDIQDDEGLDSDGKKQAIATSLMQYAAAMAAWWNRYIDLDTDEDNDLGNTVMKSGRKISGSTAAVIGKAAAMCAQAMSLHNQGVKCAKKANTHLQGILAEAQQGDFHDTPKTHFLARLKSGRKISASSAQSIKEAMDQMSAGCELHGKAIKCHKSAHAAMTDLMGDAELQVAEEPKPKEPKPEEAKPKEPAPKAADPVTDPAPEPVDPPTPIFDIAAAKGAMSAVFGELRTKITHRVQ